MEQMALSAMEFAINQYLKLDPDTIKNIAELDGKTIKIELTDWNYTFYTVANTSGIQLLASHAGEADATIKGQLRGLIATGISGANTSDLFQHKIEISGDTEIGENMRDILRHIDIDWEEHLSKIVGDSAAHGLMYYAKQTMNFGKDVFCKLTDNISSFVHHEAKCFPTKSEIEKLYRDIGTLRDDVDRAEARIQRLQTGK